MFCFLCMKAAKKNTFNTSRYADKAFISGTGFISLYLKSPVVASSYLL